MEAELENKSDNYIQLKESKNLLKLRIRDTEGNETGEMLVFDLEDIELPLRYQELIEKDKKNRAYFRNQYAIIEKQTDHKGKKLWSSKEEAKIKLMVDFYEKEVEVYNMFLGENGVQKLLNGRNLTWTTLLEIDDIIVDTILPLLKINAKDIKEKIIAKYSDNKDKRDDVIE